MKDKLKKILESICEIPDFIKHDSTGAAFMLGSISAQLEQLIEYIEENEEHVRK